MWNTLKNASWFDVAYSLELDNVYQVLWTPTFSFLDLDALVWPSVYTSIWLGVLPSRVNPLWYGLVPFVCEP